jgi:hypothetical protein
VVDHSPPVEGANHDAILDGSTAIPAGVYRICARSDMAAGLDVFSMNTSNGTQMDLYHYEKQSNQKFHIVRVGKGIYTLSPDSCPGSELSLLPSANNEAPYLGIWTASGNLAQDWIISATSSGYCRISPASAPQNALTYDESQPSLSTQQYSATAVPIRSYAGGPDQEWAIVSAAND